MKDSLALPLLLLAPLGSRPAAQTGSVGELIEIGSDTGGFGSLTGEERFGTGCADLGDVDGDGLDDLAVGAPEDGASSEGAVYVLFLDEGGAVRSSQEISATSGGFGGTLAPFDLFGWSVGALGDLDGDGVVDLAVGAIGDDTGGLGTGAVWLLFLQADGTVKDELKIASGVGGLGSSLDPGAGLGSSLSLLGDLAGDGTVELAAGAFTDDRDGSAPGGAVWILHLSATGVVSALRIGAGTGGFGGALAAGDGFGGSCACIGDLDGDGLVDLAVGAPAADDAIGSDAGAVWILFLRADGEVRSQVELDRTTEPALAGISDTDFFGSSLASVGDLDLDGVPDLAVGVTGYEEPGGASEGAVFLLFPRTDGTLVSIDVLSSADPLVGPALHDWSTLGLSLALVEDPRGPWLYAGEDSLEPFDGLFNEGALLGLRLCRGSLVADFTADVRIGAVPLAVTFQDTTSGGTPTAWSWSFGDGGSSSEQFPTHVYQALGTYDVVLRAYDATQACSKTALAFVSVQTAAMVTSRNGSGTNPDVLTSLSLPVLGTTWSTQIDGTGTSWTGLTILVGYQQPLAGLGTSFGELLVDFTSPFVFVDFGLFSGGISRHDVAIPADPSVVGLTASVQGLVNSPGVLTNALDVVIGY